MRKDWRLTIAYDDFHEIEDYWFIEHDFRNGFEVVLGTNTPNETMARRWLSMEHLKISEKEVDELVLNAKKEAGWVSV